MKLHRPIATVLLSLMICVSILAQNMTFQGRVIEVIDGTTVVVQTQSKSLFKIKCLGAEAPDTQQSFGSESRSRLSSLVLGDLVTLTFIKRDENGILLGTIRLADQNVCLDQLRSGLAWLNTDQARELTSSERSVYTAAESMARDGAVGLWNVNRQAPTAEVNSRPHTSVPPNPTKSTQNVSDSRPLTTNNSTAPTVDVSSYFRNDGTFVPAHKRTSPDGQLDNNWSATGNVNPFTGRPGNRNWFRRNWWIFPTVGALIGTGYLVRRYSNTTGGTIVCNDGWISPAQNRQGACSHHGGILR